MATMGRREAMAREMIGKKYGELTVIEYAGVDTYAGYHLVKAQCSCGQIIIRRASMIRAGKTNRCPECASKYHHKTTLCWSCAKATDRRLCSWAGGIPRKDWDAEQTTLDNGLQGGRARPVTSYTVNKCPGYVPDGREGNA